MNNDSRFRLGDDGELVPIGEEQFDYSESRYAEKSKRKKLLEIGRYAHASKKYIKQNSANHLLRLQFVKLKSYGPFFSSIFLKIKDIRR